MKRFSLRHSPLAAGAIFVACVTSAPAGAAPPAVRQIEGLPPQAVAEEAKEDLLSILQPTSRVFPENEAGSLGVRLHTAARYTGMAGLCVRDEISVDYDPSGPRDRQGKRSVRATGFQAWRTYRLVKAPAQDLSGVSAREWEATCSGLRLGEVAKWFADDDPAEAAKAANAVWAAGQAVRSGRLQPKDCDLHSVAKSCPDIVVEGARGLEIRQVARNCTPGAGQECYVVDVALDAENSFRLTIVASFDGDSVQPKSVSYVSADGPLYYRFR